MNKLIDRVHEIALGKFRRYAREKSAMGETLCELEAAQFKSRLPDYNNVAHASLYIMRYGGAYIAEYFLAFKYIIESGFLASDRISVLSLGSGSNIDGLAALFAIQKFDRLMRFTYQGVDRVEWPVLFNRNNLFKFINKDIAQLTIDDINKYGPITVLSFPKLLSEVDLSVISKALHCFLVRFLANRCCLLFSNRNAASSYYNDLELQKGNKILRTIVKIGGYKVISEFHLASDDGSYAVMPIFNIPELELADDLVKSDIIAAANDPGLYCRNRDSCPNREVYTDQKSGYQTTVCAERIGRYPMLYASWFDTHLYLLERI